MRNTKIGFANVRHWKKRNRGWRWKKREGWKGSFNTSVIYRI